MPPLTRPDVCLMLGQVDDSHRQARVLVVDAEASARQRLERTLRAEGFHVRSAASAPDAMTCATSDTPDVVLAELARANELLAAPLTDGIDAPVIVIAAGPERAAAIASVRRGAADYLMQPIEADTLVLTIERVIRTRALSRDVAALRVANEQLVADARRDSQIRTSVLSTVAHDVRAQLSTVTMVSSSLAKAASLPEEPRRKVGLLQRAAKRMERLVDDLVEFGRIEAGALDLHPSLEQASAIVDDAVRSIQPAAAERGIHLEVSVDDFTLRCARSRIVRVLEGLGSLATRVTPRDGRVRLRVEPCDGVGRFAIEHDVLGGADAERHDGAAAPSLALVVATGIARAHDGELEVERGNDGARLVLTLPLKGPRLAAPESQGPAVPAASS